MICYVLEVVFVWVGIFVVFWEVVFWEFKDDGKEGEDFVCKVEGFLLFNCKLRIV